jgi:hypothetical protein
MLISCGHVPAFIQSIYGDILSYHHSSFGCLQWFLWKVPHIFIPCGNSAEPFFSKRFYLRRLVVPAARAVGLPEQYAYLEESLARFPTAPVQEQLARSAGFSLAQHRPLAGGLMGLLELLA